MGCIVCIWHLHAHCNLFSEAETTFQNIDILNKDCVSILVYIHTSINSIVHFQSIAKSPWTESFPPSRHCRPFFAQLWGPHMCVVCLCFTKCHWMQNKNTSVFEKCVFTLPVAACPWTQLPLCTFRDSQMCDIQMHPMHTPQQVMCTLKKTYKMWLFAKSIIW